MKKTKEVIKATDVIIIGGSLVGLSAALFLARQGVPFILIEKHEKSSEHPRAMGFPERTMELFRAYGIADHIPQTNEEFDLKRATVESLSGKWITESTWTPKEKNKGKSINSYSPCMGAAIPQDKLEPILRRHIKELGGTLWLGNELLHFEQTFSKVIAFIRDRRTNKEYKLAAKYLIAADGHNSPVRKVLRIGQKGIGNLQVMRSVLFRAPLEVYLESGISQFNIEQPDFKAFLTTYQDHRWVLMFKDDIDRNEKELRQAIQKAVGRTDFPIEIITTGRWNLSALIADRFQEGRVFLAGDSAHTLPPTRGGFGANTGIQDAHNLAWKLKAVLSGVSSPNLLQTYGEERRPISWERYEQMFARPDYSKYISGDVLQKVRIYDDVSMELGQIYRSAGIIANKQKMEEGPKRPKQWKGSPGIRAPHLWIFQRNKKKSLLDLFQNGWVLLTAYKDWKEVAEKINLNLELKVYVEEEDFSVIESTNFTDLYGIGKYGASLIRPDGFIACRFDNFSENIENSLLRSLQQAAFLRATP